MNFEYKRAGIEDIDTLVDTRIEVLLAANKLDENTDMYEVRTQSYNYYSKALADNTPYSISDF